MTGEVIEGYLPAKALAMVREGLSIHKDARHRVGGSALPGKAGSSVKPQDTGFRIGIQELNRRTSCSQGPEYPPQRIILTK